MTKIAGIDPGKSGGIAIYFRGEFNAFDLPSEPHELYAILDDCDTAVIEDVPAFAGKNIPSHTSFKLGKSCGIVEAAADIAGCQIVMLRPQQWQAEVGLKRNKWETQSQWKSRLRDIATELTGVNATLKTADALLLAFAGVLRFSRL